MRHLKKYQCQNEYCFRQQPIFSLVWQESSAKSWQHWNISRQAGATPSCPTSRGAYNLIDLHIVIFKANWSLAVTIGIIDMDGKFAGLVCYAGSKLKICH
jgi:hypothetical protein